jgi:hypothetical protein
MPRRASPIPWQERKKWVRIKRFLPCFFDVPAKDVHRILSISHHRLDPLRRALNLDCWPYNEVARNQFCMSREEIEGLRSRMMEVADAPMRETLERMRERARECKVESKLPRTKTPAYKRAKPDALTEVIEQGFSAEPFPLPPCKRARRVEEPVQEDQLPSMSGELWEELARLPEDQVFWDEISRILLPDENEPFEPCPLFS